MRQRGQALILVLLLLSVAVVAALLSFFSSTKVALDNDQKTADALALAKTALIGRAVADANIPGSFPCPDLNNNGQLDLGIDFSGNTCVSYLGRLPWKTLGLPDLRDGSGERLWYALSPNFRDNPSVSPLNSDTRGTITVFAADGAAKLTSEAVAVIFAPGAALGDQIRDSANENIAANYLDASAGRNNANTGGPFIVGARGATYNDRVLYVITPEVIPIVEQRVASELKTMIQSYYNTNGHFPFAAAYNDTSRNCALNVTRGRLPASLTTAPNAPNNACAETVDWAPPAWFGPNHWYEVIYYSVAPGYIQGGVGTCAGGCLTVGSNTSIPALFFTPGTPRGTITRPSDTLSDYLEDAQNQDGWSALANDIYVTPTASALDRDRVFILAGGASNPQCANNAAALLALAPCGQPPKLNPQCTTFSSNLAACGCYAASTVVINPPCQNTLKPSACQAAVATLKACSS